LEYLRYKYTYQLYFSYKIQNTFANLTKYKVQVHQMYFKYIFQLLVFQLQYNTE